MATGNWWNFTSMFNNLWGDGGKIDLEGKSRKEKFAAIQHSINIIVERHDELRKSHSDFKYDTEMSDKIDAIARHLGLEFEDRDSLNKYELVKPEEKDDE